MPRVLIVEDEPMISLLLEDWLAELGHEAVGPIASAADGVKAVGEVALDMALVDINLGGQRSDAIADALAERKIPFAFMTGGSGDSVIQRFSGRPKLLKPFNFESLSAVLDKLGKYP